MRCFIAAKIPEKIKDKLEKIQINLHRSGIRATWVKRKAAHLTFIFLGEINPEQAETTANILKSTQTTKVGNNPIHLKLTQLGAFPSLDFPKTIWLGLGGEIAEVKRLDSLIRERLKEEKIPFDPKPFVAHLTLGRLRRMKPRQRKQISKILKQIKLKEKPEFEISQITLIKSKLTPKGPIYTSLEKINLSFF